MKETYIVLDSTSYFEENFLNENKIEVVSLSVELDGKVFKEGLIGTYDEYFSALKSSKNFPKTSQPPVGDFEKTYRKLIEKGAKNILVMTFSSNLSGTYNSANLAKSLIEEDINIKVIDTLTVVGIYRYCVTKSIEMIENNKSLNDIEEKVKKIVSNSKLDVTVENIEFLKRGGRLTNAQAFVANVLNIKPIITLIDGKLVGNGKVRGKKKAIKKLIDGIIDNVGHIVIENVQSYNESLDIKNKILEIYPNVKVDISELGPVIGSHLGPGGIGICSIRKID